MAEMPDLIAYQEKQQRQTAAKKPDLMAYQERQEAKKASAAPYNDILVQEARKYGASRARSERSSHRTANHADAERRAQAQVVSDTVRDKKGGMLGGTVRGWLAGQVGAVASGLEALQAADWAVSPEKASIDASRRNIENYTAKRDAAQTAEERARWQQLIDRNERLIAINSEAYAKKTADVENAVGKLGDTRAKLKSDAEYGIAKEKEGLGAIGRTAVDVGVAGGQMAMDALAGGLPSIATRVFGDSTQEAKETISPDATTAERMEGKTKALAYGAGSAAVSVGTEKLANIAAPFKKVFGNGMFDKAIDGALAKMSGSAAGKAALKAAGSFATEGLEEVVEDALQPILQKATYDENALSQYKDTDYWTNVLYDGLIGGILGLAGSGAEIAGNAITRGESAKFSPQEGAEATRANGEGNLTPDAQNAPQGTQSALNENGLAALTEHEKENLSSGKKNKVVSTFQDAVDFVRRALSDKTNVDRAYLGKVPASTAQMVLQETGVNIEGYNAVIPSDAVRHMFKHHGDPLVEQARGQVHLTPDAVARIPEILTAPDKVSLSAKQDTNGRPALIFEKQIGDNYITVQAISNGTHSIQADTLYIRKRTPQDTVSNTETTSALNSNVRNVPPQEFSSADSVAHGFDPVNTQDMRSAREYAPERHIDNRTSESVGAQPVTERTAEELPIWDVDGLGGANRGSLNSDFQNMQERSDEFHRVNRTAEERTAELHGRAPSEVPTVNPATGKAVSKAVSTILNSPVTSNEFAEVIEQAVAGGTFDYLPITDKAAHTAAQDAIRRAGGYQTVADEFNVLASLGQSVGKENMARGIAAYNEAVAAGDHVTAFELLTNIAQSAHTSAQTVQAMNLLNRLTPAGKLLSLRRYVDSVNRKAQERGTGRRRRAADAETVQTNFVDQYDGIFIDPELADAYLTAESDAGRKAAWDAITQSIADQSPSTFREKADAWRYLSMLGNPTTHVRNLAGNAIQLGARTVKNTIGALIEPMVVRDSSQRTKSVVGRSGADAKLRQWAKEQYAADQQSAMGGGKYSEYNASGIAREIEEKRRAQVFGKSGVGKAVNAASRWNTAALDRGDVIFNRPAYVESFAQALKAKGVTAEEAQSGAKPELVAAAREYAINEAQKATYRNTTALSELLARAGHYQGDNKAAKALSIAYDAVMPFRKTPANILTTGLDYSPVGIAKAVKQAAVDVKSGKATAADAVDSLCEGLTGTGILALGAYLASEGLLNLRAGDDDDEEAFNKTLGHQDYALELGGRSYTLDWAVPAAIPLFAGAALVEGGMDFGGLMDAVSNIGDVVLETSMLSTFNDIIRNISYADNPMASAVGRVASSYASQFLPTIGGKIASALDDTVRKSYVESGTSQLERDAKYFGQTVLRKTPFAREAMQPSIDMWGEEVSNGDPLLRIIQNSVSPSTVKEIKNDAVTQEVRRLYEATGEGLPSAAEKSFVVNGERKYLTGEEYTEYAKVMGQTRRQVLEPLLKSKGYQKLSDAEKAKAVGYAYEYAKVKGKQAVSDYKVSDSSVAKGMMQSVMPPETYILYKVTADKDNNGSVTSVESAQALKNLTGLTDRQRGKAWEEKNSTTKPEKNPFTGALVEAGTSVSTSISILDKYRELYNAEGMKPKEKAADFRAYVYGLGLTPAQIAAAQSTYTFFGSYPIEW